MCAWAQIGPVLTRVATDAGLVTCCFVSFERLLAWTELTRSCPDQPTVQHVVQLSSHQVRVFQTSHSLPCIVAIVVRHQSRGRLQIAAKTFHHHPLADTSSSTFQTQKQRTQPLFDQLVPG